MAQRRWEDKLQGWRDGPTESSHHAAPTSLSPPLACLSGSQTLLSVFFFPFQGFLSGCKEAKVWERRSSLPTPAGNSGMEGCSWLGKLFLVAELA